MRLKAGLLATAITLALAAPAGAHDGYGDWDTQPYCGFGDGGVRTVVGGFGGFEFDRYEGTRIVTPGAPGDYPRWHAVLHTYAHFYFGYRYTDERICRWGFW